MRFMEFLIQLFNSISTNQVFMQFKPIFMQFYLKINPVYLIFSNNIPFKILISFIKSIFLSNFKHFFYSDIKIDHFHNILSLFE